MRITYSKLLVTAALRVTHINLADWEHPTIGCMRKVRAAPSCFRQCASAPESLHCLCALCCHADCGPSPDPAYSFACDLGATRTWGRADVIEITVPVTGTAPATNLANFAVAVDNLNRTANDTAAVDVVPEPYGVGVERLSVAVLNVKVGRLTTAVHTMCASFGLA